MTVRYQLRDLNDMAVKPLEENGSDILARR